MLFLWQHKFPGPALPQLWHGSPLWPRFDPWAWNFHMLRVQLKKEEGKKKKNKHELDGSVSVGLQAETD